MEKKLVFDIGMHKGEDTAHYLKMGYPVIAIEANPILAEQNSKTFADYIRDGKLIILNKGISDNAGILKFWINHKYSEWSSFNREIGCRNDTACHAVDVDCITIQQLFQRHGIPYYMKVDIEGNDWYCLAGIDPMMKPKYVSCEACHLEWLEILKHKGYTKFKLINQLDGFHAYDINREKSTTRLIRNKIRWRLLKTFTSKAAYTTGGSGPFAEQAEGQWHSFEELSAQYLSFYSNKEKPLNFHSWFDFHATY